MLSIYKDSQLKLLANATAPKRFLLPLKGGSVASSLFIGDPYTSTVTATGAIAATSLSLDQTFELPTPGLLVIGAQTILYTGKTATSVTGIPTSGAGSITSAITAGSVATPQLVYASTSTLRVDPLGVESSPDLSVQLKRANQTTYNFPNTPALYTQTTISSGLASAVELDVQLNSVAGVQQEFTNLSLAANTFTCAENLAIKSEQIDDPAWVKATTGATPAPTVTANAVTAPDGVSLTADKIVFASTDATSNLTVSQTINVPTTAAGQFYCVSFWLRADVTVSNLGFVLYGRTNGALGTPWNSPSVSSNATLLNGASPNLTTTWQQFFFVGDAGALAGQTQIAIVLRLLTSQTGITVYAWGAQVNHGTLPATYVATNTLPQPGRAGDTVTLQAPLYVFRRDQALPQALRLLPTSRQVNAALPGFLLGQYRWRDQDTINESTIVPTQWDQDPTAIGIEKFVSGFGHGNDLKPVGLTSVDDSIFMQVGNGTYFSGPFRHYLPAGKTIEFFSATGNGPITYTLKSPPTSQTPVFVGTWKLDAQRYYENDTAYRYMATGISAAVGAPAFQFSVNRKLQQVTINTPPPQKILFLGTISGQQTDYFDLPLYPVDRIDRIYVDRGLTALAVDATNWVFNRDDGTVQVINPNSSTAGPSIPTTLVGEPVFALIQPAVAVEYETGDTGMLTVDSLDINPAFSGLSSGHFYLQQRRQKADTIQLSVDKPVIAIPPTHDTIVGLTAYGPVYFDGDYAMLIAQALSKTPGEAVPNVQMKAILDPTTFTGLLNYRNPVATITAAASVSGVVTYTGSNSFQAGDTVTITALSDTTFNGVYTVAAASSTSFTVNLGRANASISAQTGFAVIDITVRTGGDGTANLIYIPTSGYGVWLPTTAAAGTITTNSLGGVKTITLTNDSLVLPTTVPISQIWNAKEGWLVNTYSVLNNDPLFGIVGGNTAQGQVPFTTQGTPGAVGYKTNGERSLWSTGTSAGSAPILPIEAFDVAGNGHLAGGFSGSVKYLKFGQSLPAPTGLAAYFVTFVQRITVQLQAIGSNVVSQPILLQMAVPPVIIQNPWLILEDDIQGRINQFRLGWVRPTPTGPTR